MSEGPTGDGDDRDDGPDFTWDRQAERYLAGMALTIVASATVAYHLLERWSWVDSLYFSVVAVTTVGFGDLTPTTDLAKLFTVFYLISGIAVIGLYIDHRLKVRSRRISSRRRRRRRPGRDRPAA